MFLRVRVCVSVRVCVLCLHQTSRRTLRQAPALLTWGDVTATKQPALQLCAKATQTNNSQHLALALCLAVVLRTREVLTRLILATSL